jgi:two-component system, OmpR family, sensor histidine kinase ChvG
MTAGVEERPLGVAREAPSRLGKVLHGLARLVRFAGIHAFSSLTRRIIVLNLAALVVLVSGILYLNQFRAGLTEARVSSLLTQGEIIAQTIAERASGDVPTVPFDPNDFLNLQVGQSLSTLDRPSAGIEFLINPERVAPIIRALATPTGTRARIYDRDGTLIVDTRHLYSRGQILRYELPPPAAEDRSYLDWFAGAINTWLQSSDLPVYKELGGANGKNYQEVVTALSGSPTSIVRITERGEQIVSVAVPIQRYRTVIGSLLLSTQGGDIDAIVHAERMAIVRVFLVAASVTILLSILLAGTIAMPLRRLADAADRVRRGVKSRQQIPDFADRGDEVGHLGQALHDMTNSLYSRIDAIENFAADVAHELKNPLTSLRSAVETLPLARTDEAKKKLTAIIQHDVRRLDRLISDISNASRLDAELGRQDAAPVDLERLLQTVIVMARETTPADGDKLAFDVKRVSDPAAYFILGHDGRLGQVFNNLIDNARSFCREGGTVRVAIRPIAKAIEVVVQDDGPGIRPDQFERIFERFYTDRGDNGDFGQNSGLGLSITKQIVEAHRGRIWAENRTTRGTGENAEPVVLGARFVVQLPTE